ncbi:Clp protease N-terminal domain-containing protein, partial [Aeromicrobium sp.]|uniref:Clp protease N-terminal domain-containing protein n=1 Tax=Aeromicrobium sp. TaxID=1871063 RepID=UPI003D6C157C
MDLSTYTTRSQQALAVAIQAAAAAGNPSVEPGHLLDALLAQAGGTTAPLLSAVGVDPQAVSVQLKDELGRLPSASGANVGNPTLSRSSHEVLQRAQDLAAQLGDEFVSSEHLVVGVATVESPARHVLTA